MNRYDIVYHLHAPDGRKRVGGTCQLRTDEVITKKGHPALLARATEILRGRKHDIQPGDVVSVAAAYHRTDEGCIPWIPPTCIPLGDDSPVGE